MLTGRRRAANCWNTAQLLVEPTSQSLQGQKHKAVPNPLLDQGTESHETTEPQISVDWDILAFKGSSILLEWW